MASHSSPSASPEPDPIIAVTARLKQLARESLAARAPYRPDNSEHYKLFSRAVHNVLSTDLALFTFAQIVDGLPTAEVAADRRFPDISYADDDHHPIEEHLELCPGTMERTREIHQQFELSALLFDPTVWLTPPTKVPQGRGQDWMLKTWNSW
jgi:hypothetical protein